MSRRKGNIQTAVLLCVMVLSVAVSLIGLSKQSVISVRKEADKLFDAYTACSIADIAAYQALADYEAGQMQNKSDAVSLIEVSNTENEKIKQLLQSKVKKAKITSEVYGQQLVISGKICGIEVEKEYNLETLKTEKIKIK